MSEENVQTPTTSTTTPSPAPPPQQQQQQHEAPRTSIRAEKIKAIQKMKNGYYSFPLEKKLQKLGNHSKCQTESCSCEGWRNAKDPNKIDLCTCGHILEMHVTHLKEKSEALLNYLLSMVVDIENISIVARNEKEEESKQYYIHIFRVLKWDFPFQFVINDFF